MVTMMRMIPELLCAVEKKLYRSQVLFTYLLGFLFSSRFFCRFPRSYISVFLADCRGLGANWFISVGYDNWW